MHTHFNQTTAPASQLLGPRSQPIANHDPPIHRATPRRSPLPPPQHTHTHTTQPHLQEGLRVHVEDGPAGVALWDDGRGPEGGQQRLNNPPPHTHTHRVHGLQSCDFPAGTRAVMPVRIAVPCTCVCTRVRVQVAQLQVGLAARQAEVEPALRWPSRDALQPGRGRGPLLSGAKQLAGHRPPAAAGQQPPASSHPTPNTPTCIHHAATACGCRWRTTSRCVGVSCATSTISVLRSPPSYLDTSRPAGPGGGGGKGEQVTCVLCARPCVSVSTPFPPPPPHTHASPPACTHTRACKRASGATHALA